jgi:hypothetical protein
MAQPGDGVRDKSHLHRQSVDLLVVGETPQALEAVKQAMLGGGHPPLFGSGIRPCEFGEAEGLLQRVLFFRMALSRRARLVCWVVTRKGAAASIAARAR